MMALFERSELIIRKGEESVVNHLDRAAERGSRRARRGGRSHRVDQDAAGTC